MKRFLSIMLTALLLVSAVPTVSAEETVNEIGSVVAEELNFENQEEITEEITEEVAENVIEDVSEEISGEGEENSEEQIRLMSGENDISLMAASDYNASDYKKKDTSTVMACSGDSNCGGYADFYFDDLEQARQFILASSKDRGEKQITFLKDITLNSTYDFKDYKMKFLVKSGANITVSVNFLTSENSMLDTIFQVDGGCIAFLNTSGNAQGLTFKDITNYDSVNQSPKSFVTIKNGIEPSARSSAVIGANDKATLEFQNFGCTNGVFNIENSRQAFGYVKISGTRNGYPDVVVKGTSTRIDGGDDIPVFCLADKSSSLSTSDIFNCSKNYNIITREDLYPGSTKETNDVLVTGTRAPIFVDKFIYTAYDAAGNPNKKGVLAGTDSLVVTSAPTYTVTVVNPPFSGSYVLCYIKVNGSESIGSIPEGTELNFTYVDSQAKSNAYVFDKYIVTTASGKVTNVADGESYIMPGENITVTAKFNPSPYFCVRSYGVKGFPNAKKEEYPQNDETTGEAWQGGAAVYKVYFLDGGDNKNDAGTMTLNQEGGLIVRSSRYTSTIQAMSSVGSTVTATLNIDETKYKVGTVTVTTKAGTTIESNYNADAKTATFTLPDIDYGGDAQVYINVNLVQVPYNITVKKNIEGAGTVTYEATDYSGQIHSKTDVGYNDRVCITTTKENNYKIKNIKVTDSNGNTIAESAELKMFYMPASDVTVTVEFELDACGITIGSCEYGTVTTNPSDTATVGSEVIITATPDTNYELDTLTVTTASGTPVTVEDNKFTMPSESVTIKATFVKKKFAVKVETPVNGTVSCDEDGQNVEWGTEISFTVTPDAFYAIDKVTVNGAELTSVEDGTYKFTTEAEDSIIKATFKKQQFSVTASATTNGEISLLTESPLNWGDSFIINVKADPHYEIDTVTVDGTNVTVDERGDYTFEMPTHDVTVSATFKKVKYTITGAGEHVTFAIPNSDTYDWGDNVKITVTPEQWYTVKSVNADDNTVAITPVAGEENTYSFIMPRGNITITALTERPNFNVTFNSMGGSAVTPTVVANGDTVTKPAVPVWAGRGFAGWYLDAECIQKYDFTQPVTADIALYARWFLWGDVNGDGAVDSYDAFLIRRCRADLADYSLIQNRLAGFVNGLESSRQYPDSGDAVSIRRFCANIITRYKVEDSAAGYEFDLENNTYISVNQ